MALRPLVIKLGGDALSCSRKLDAIFDAISSSEILTKRPLVIVHGGGCFVDEALSVYGFSSEKKQGVRITPKEQINLVVGMLAGTANKLLQARAIKYGINAIGFCLSDGNTCRIEQQAKFGSVAHAMANNPLFLSSILQSGFLPIFSSIGIDEKGELMNVNADDGAVAIAIALNAQLVLLSDVSGVLDGKGVLIPELSKEKALDLIESGVISAGMIIKVKAAFEAATSLGHSVELASWRNSKKLIDLFTGKCIGTRFILSSSPLKAKLC